MPASNGLNGREVTFVRLHSVTHIDGNGQVGPNIGGKDTSNRFNDFTMIKVHGGVVLKSSGARYMGSAAGVVGKPFEVYIPDAACQSIQLKCDE